MQPTLYLLAPSLDEQPLVCPECALIEGIMAYYPAIRGAVAVKRIGFSRPRADLVAALGEPHQSAPVVIFPAGADAPAAAHAGLDGKRFLAGGEAIAAYFADLGLAGRLAS
ncbi:DUF3088 family protein [Sphingopyxis witflariensis]|nr:DUF3088 family protein [Sphingopyxis witflariensis]